MYSMMLVLHNFTRWLVVISMIFAVGWSVFGWLQGRAWTKWDTRFGLAFMVLITVQFMWGVVLYLIPNGLAQAAWQDMGVAMNIRELRFFGLEHPIQMIIALTLVHLGWTRSRKATITKTKFRWAAGTYSMATLLILSAIPWWRPVLRGFDNNSAAPVSVQASAGLVGDATAGELLFSQSIEGQAACIACHTIDESRLVGPGLGGIATRAETRVGGLSAEDYIFTSIVAPANYVVEGYANVMPSSFGDSLSEQQVSDIVAYLLTLD